MPFQRPCGCRLLAAGTAGRCARGCPGDRARHPRGGEFDRERNAIQAPAERGHRRRVARRQLEVGPHGACPLHEERTASASATSSTSFGASVAGRPSDGVGQLCSPSTPSASLLVATIRTAGHTSSSTSTRPSRRVQEMLAVVEHQQQPARADGVTQHVHQRPRRPLRNSQRRRDRARDQGRVANRREPRQTTPRQGTDPPRRPRAAPRGASCPRHRPP